jgi:hypothetical protein
MHFLSASISVSVTLSVGIGIGHFTYLSVSDPEKPEFRKTVSSVSGDTPNPIGKYCLSL